MLLHSFRYRLGFCTHLLGPGRVLTRFYPDSPGFLSGFQVDGPKLDVQGGKLVLNNPTERDKLSIFAYKSLIYQGFSRYYDIFGFFN